MADSEGAQSMKQKIVFGTFAETGEQLQHAFFLVESAREFAGKFKDAPIWVYIPKDLESGNKPLLEKITFLGAEIKTSSAPEEALRYYFARKVYAAGKAESEAEGIADILVWMDEDTIVLGEPADFELQEGINFAYRPVMHNRSGSLFSEPPDSFWSRIYKTLSIEDSSILRRWGKDFTTLYSDSVLADMCENDVEKRIFIHQTALVGAVLNNLKKENLMELSDRYNYPIFFHQQYESAREFGSIEDIITLRYDVYFRNPDPEWSNKLKGPLPLVDWLRQKLGENQE
jgi:hypothetical protein